MKKEIKINIIIILTVLIVAIFAGIFSFQVSYNKGYSEGTASGNKTGYNKGYETGYIEGYKTGTKTEAKKYKSVDATDVSPTVYITASGEKYHNEHCQYVAGRGIAIPKNEAEKEYSPCSVCDP